MRIAYVVPRYGLEVVGGAELGARMLAERLVANLGWQVEVLTTCAQDASTWADEYPPGEELVNGVLVRRFSSQAGRDPGFEEFSQRLLRHPEGVSSADQERWVELQGPVCPELLDTLAETPADVAAFYPYLYHPTVAGIGRQKGRAVMHPAAHDEPPLRLPLFRDVFEAADGLVFQTWGERRLVESRFPVAHAPAVVVGLGVEPTDGEPGPARDLLGVGDRPYLCCLGRVDDGKGAGLLAAFFAAFKRRHPGPLALVFVGPVVHRPPPHPDIFVVGAVDEATKWGALRGALALVSPSPLEAFSLVLVEGWQAGLPALVNARCAATVEHCRRSGGGLWFSSYATFEATIGRLVSSTTLRARLARAGAHYVEQRFSWPAVIDRYSSFLTEVAQRP
ncbi:MAG: glycosyltransferase family 4 protein [Acidimicrobiia bacterium]